MWHHSQTQSPGKASWKRSSAEGREVRLAARVTGTTGGQKSWWSWRTSVRQEHRMQSEDTQSKRMEWEEGTDYEAFYIYAKLRNFWLLLETNGESSKGLKKGRFSIHLL